MSNARNPLAGVLRWSLGDLTITVMNDGSVVNKGTFPMLAKGRAYKFQTDRTGALTAINETDPTDRVVVDKNFGFAEIDPTVKRADTIQQHKDNLAVA